MKVSITGFNPYGAIETKEYDLDGSPDGVATDLMPLSITVDSGGYQGSMRFDYETVKETEPEGSEEN